MAIPGAETGAPPVAPGTAPGSPAPAGVVLNAVSRSWVQVRSGGKVIYDHVLAPGESWTLPPGAADATLTTGNAGGVTVSAGGTTTPPLGRVGSVRRNLPLTADAVRAGTLVDGAPLPNDTSGQHPPADAAKGATPERAPIARDTVPGQQGSATATPGARMPVSPPTGSDHAADGSAPPQAVPPGPGTGAATAGANPVTHRRSPPPKPAPVVHEMTADELNARQLKQNASPAH